MVIHSHSPIVKRLSPHPFSFACYILKPLRGPLSTFLYFTVYELSCLRQSTPFFPPSFSPSLSFCQSLSIDCRDWHTHCLWSNRTHPWSASISSASLFSKLSSLLRISGVLESRTMLSIKPKENTGKKLPRPLTSIVKRFIWLVAVRCTVKLWQLEWLCLKIFHEHIITLAFLNTFNILIYFKHDFSVNSIYWNREWDGFL